jgi:hypothetical protein
LSGFVSAVTICFLEIPYFLFNQCLVSCYIESGSGSSISSEFGSGSKVLDQKLKKKIQMKTIYLFLIKNFSLLISRPPYRTSKVQENPSALKREHSALQTIKLILYFSG